MSVQDRLPASTAAPPASSLSPPPPAQDWPAQATAQIVKTVDLVREKTAEPATNAARAVVYGTVIAILAVTAAALACVMLIRFVDIWVPGDVYWAYLIVGGLLVVAGAVAWSLRWRKTPPEEA
jgi:Putative Actinobacterial Holin-X, holin superfamily III